MATNSAPPPATKEIDPPPEIAGEVLGKFFFIWRN